MKISELLYICLAPFSSVLARDTPGDIPTEKEQKTTLFTESSAIDTLGICLCPTQCRVLPTGMCVNSSTPQIVAEHPRCGEHRGRQRRYTSEEYRHDFWPHGAESLMGKILN